MRKISADLIYPVDQAVLKNAVIITDDYGKVLGIDSLSNHDDSSIEIYKGAIIPGLINSHCHIELSHLKAKVATGTGLISFITDVISKRAMPAEVIQESIARASSEMWDNGIMAVGDISNVTDSFKVKSESQLDFYTFVEMFDLLQDEDAQSNFDQYYKVFNDLDVPEYSKKSIVPHAPYSVSPTLFHLINAHTPTERKTVSVHNQETNAENKLFLQGKGAFVDWYESIGYPLKKFNTTQQTSIHYLLEYLNPNNRTLFVHNTMTTEADIQAAHKWSAHCYWATCPNANLYIENRLPYYQNFLNTKAKMTIGTDSLTSNWQLCILEEMKTILKYQSYISFETVLKWATLNGAEALGFENRLGSITVGKAPGLLLLEDFDGELTACTKVTRL